MSKHRFRARIRPGGLIVIPRPILLALGLEPGTASQVTIEIRGNRLVVGKKPSPLDVRLMKFKARLADRGRVTKLFGGHPITDWLSTGLDNLDREALATSLQTDRTTYGVHPTESGKLIRVNPDGTRDVGRWVDDEFKLFNT